MQRIQKFLQRLFSLRNLAPLVIIVVAVVGSLGVRPFGISFSSDQIIMALLAFLAIDALVERLELLTNIEEQVRSIHKTLTPKIGSDNFLKKRDFQWLENLVTESQNEIWVSGVTLDSMVALIHVFERKIKQGCKVRFLAPDPDSPALIEIAKYFASDPDFIAARIRSNLGVLSSRLQRISNNSLEIRLLDKILTTGYVISDSGNGRGRMVVQLYSYWIGVEGSPLFELSAGNDKQWYPIYYRQFEKAWDDAKPFIYKINSEK